MDFNCLKIGDEYGISFIISGDNGNLSDVVANITVTPDLEIVNIASKISSTSTNPSLNLGTILKGENAVIVVKVAILSVKNLVDDNYKITLSTTTSTSQDTGDDTLAKNLHKEFSFFERCDQQLSVTDLDPNYELVNAPDGLRVQLREGFIDFGTSAFVGVGGDIDQDIFLTATGTSGYTYPCTIVVNPINGSNPISITSILVSANNLYSIPRPAFPGLPRDWDVGDEIIITCNGYSETFLFEEA